MMSLPRALVALGFVFAAFSPVRTASAGNGLGVDGGMSAADARAAADAAFDNLRDTKADNPFEKKLVDDAKARFGRTFDHMAQQWGDKPISSKTVKDIGSALDTMMGQLEQYIDVIQNPSLGTDEKRQKLQELTAKFKQDHQDHGGDRNGGSGQSGGGDRNGGGRRSGGGDRNGDGVIDFPIDRLATNSLAQAAIAASQSLIPSQDRGGMPSPGSVFGGVGGAPNDAMSAVTAATDKMFKGDLPGALAMADKAVGMGGGPDALNLRGGINLDLNNFSKANADAKAALQQRPGDKDAQAIVKFSEGRVDGVSQGSQPAGKNGPGGDGGSSASSGGGGGSSGSGLGSSGGRVDSGSGGLSGSMGLSAGGPGGGPGGAGLAGLSSAQAQKGAANALALGDLGGAMAFVNRGLAQNPRDPALLNLRSSIYAKQHDYKSAIADAKAGLLLDPKNAALLRSLGFAQLRDRDFQGALATANEMLELNPNDPYAYALRGHAYGSLGDRDAMMADLQRAAELDPSFAAAAAQMANKLQLPEDKDILFLFPGEEAASAAKTAPASGRGRQFGLLVGASALGGLLLAMGLLATVLAPLKEKLTSAFTRITRTGPTVGAVLEDDTARPASVNGLMPGLIRGQYEISRQIGVGGMGVVYAGTDRALGRPVAIKKMRDEVRFDAREKARFVSEAKTVAALHHPNIVDIYAIAEEGDDVFLVFEYVDGRTVHDLVQASGKLEPEAAAKIVRASADALEYAHSRGVIHRDMKPSNVMLDQSGAVKVMDFGIARMAKDTLLRQSMTNTVAGTPPYMAPEQEQGQVRKESDVYSLAICAYEMLTGKLPFVGLAGGMLLNKINMSFVPPSRETAGLPAALDPVFERAFQADPDKRYPTPREFADALKSALPAAVRAA